MLTQGNKVLRLEVQDLQAKLLEHDQRQDKMLNNINEMTAAMRASKVRRFE